MTIDDKNRTRTDEKKILPAATACNYSLLLSCLRFLTKKIRRLNTWLACAYVEESWLVVEKDNGKYIDDVCNEVEAPAALATKWHQKCSNASSHKNNLIPFFSSSLSLCRPDCKWGCGIEMTIRFVVGFCFGFGQFPLQRINFEHKNVFETMRSLQTGKTKIMRGFGQKISCHTYRWAPLNVVNAFNLIYYHGKWLCVLFLLFPTFSTYFQCKFNVGKTPFNFFYCVFFLSLWTFRR